MIDDRPELRESLHNGSAESVERLRAEFGDLLRERPMTRDQMYRATSTWFSDDDVMYRELGDAYRFIFGEPKDPKAPTAPAS
jgi:hypothetical protein